MPELKCTVTTCKYNDDRLCHLDVIEVGGSNATVSHETSCNSFVKRDGQSYTNSSKTPSERCSIDCKATQCNYNEQQRCHAGKISVEGNNASCDHETSCGTFTCGK